MSEQDNRPEERVKPTNKYGLSDEEAQRLRRAQRRNVVFAVVGGLILAVLGFFAAQNLNSDAALATLVEAGHVWPL